MLNMHLSYKSLSSCRILFWSGWRPRQFSRLKKCRALMVPGGGFRKGVIIQGRQLPSGLSVIGQSCLIIKGVITGASVHEPIHSNSTYVQIVIRYIYDTRRPEHPHSPISQYERLPQGSASRPCYIARVVWSAAIKFYKFSRSVFVSCWNHQ